MPANSQVDDALLVAGRKPTACMMGQTDRQTDKQCQYITSRGGSLANPHVDNALLVVAVKRNSQYETELRVEQCRVHAHLKYEPISVQMYLNCKVPTGKIFQLLLDKVPSVL